jgi:hypothetical protein
VHRKKVTVFSSTYLESDIAFQKAPIACSQVYASSEKLNDHLFCPNLVQIQRFPLQVAKTFLIARIRIQGQLTLWKGWCLNPVVVVKDGV